MGLKSHSSLDFYFSLSLLPSPFAFSSFAGFFILRSRFFSKYSVPCLKLNLIVSNTQNNSQLFLKKFFSQELSNYAFEGFICRQENVTAVLDGILDFDSFLNTAALITHLIFSVGGEEKSSKSNRKRNSLESSFRSELLFRDHSRSTRQFALVKQERFYLTKACREKKSCRDLENKTIINCENTLRVHFHGIILHMSQ